MDPATEPRLCHSCGKALRGRSDKKYCDDYCRSQYNNQIKSDGDTIVRRVNAVLRKNRTILQKVLPQGEEMYKLPRERLLQMGFNLKHITHTYTNKKGNVYFFCYDFGYLPLEHDWYLVVRRKE